MTTHNAQAVRQRLLQALADNRRPGFNFAGNFVGIRWPRIGADSVEVAMDAGPHVNGADGNVDVVALGVLMDLGLATVPRLRVPPGARQATVSLHAQFTGHPARGNLVAQTGEPPGGRDGPAGQRLAAGLVRNDQHVLMHLQGAFVLLPSPDGKHLAPLPWQCPPVPPASPLQPHTRHVFDEGLRLLQRLAEGCRLDAAHRFVVRGNVLPVEIKFRRGSGCRIGFADISGADFGARGDAACRRQQ